MTEDFPHSNIRIIMTFRQIKVQFACIVWFTMLRCLRIDAKNHNYSDLQKCFQVFQNANYWQLMIMAYLIALRCSSPSTSYSYLFYNVRKKCIELLKVIHIFITLGLLWMTNKNSSSHWMLNARFFSSWLWMCIRQDIGLHNSYC